MKAPENRKYVLFGGTFVLANKLQVVGDKMVEGLSTKQWFLLRNMLELPREPMPTITQIAKVMDSTRQNITKMLEVMEREGLVAFADNERDRRSRCVRITDEGLAYVKQTSENAGMFFENLYEGIDENELKAASGVLVKMVQNLEKMQREVGE